MRPGILPAYLRFAICIAALTFMAAVSNSFSFGAPQRSRPERNRNLVLQRMMIPGTEDLQLVVELSEPTVLQRMKTSGGRQMEIAGSGRERSRRMNFYSPEAMGYRREIGRTQDLLGKRIKELKDARILARTSTVMNSLIVRVPASQYWAIRRLPGVKKVYFSRPYRMLLDKAAEIQSAQELWNKIEGGKNYAGRGIKIAVIDSGIDITNPMFSGSGMAMPPGFPIGDSGYTNNKVIVARTYFELMNPQTNQTAEDEVGHGTFLAGCAAGQQANAPLASISGMAPGAYLGSYKIFGTPGINDSVGNDIIMKAIDDAVADGMDIINFSLGRLDHLLPEEDPAYVALKKAVDAGVILTIAAGNTGPGTQTISSPGVLPDAITVGSVTSSREFLPAVHAQNSSLAAIGYVSSFDGPKVTDFIDYTSIVDVASLDSNGLACSNLPLGSLADAVALIKRGECHFLVKVLNAKAAGAKAVIVYNNLPHGIIEMSGLDSTTIPAVMISKTSGDLLKGYANTPNAKVSIDNFSTLQWVDITPRVLSSFSGVGPGTDFSIKPDLVAVGENVYSATQSKNLNSPMYDQSGFTVSQGTSFSAPMVAGAAAALLERHPELMDQPQAIKSLLTNTATLNITVDGKAAPNLLQAGAGLLNMGNAASATAVFFPSSLSFGVHSYTGHISLSSTLTIKNISSATDEFTLALEPVVSGPSITFSRTNTGTIAPGSSTAVEIRLEADDPNTGGFQGYIAVSSSTGFTYRLPYWAGLYISGSNRVLPVYQNATGNDAYANLESAIAAAQPGDTIEIQDNGTYDTGPAGLVISTNSQGLPLHGLTIRAAEGKTPKIEAEDYTVGITVIGLKNVLFQHLNFQRGAIAIDLWQPSPNTPLSATIDDCIIGNTSGAGILVDNGGAVDITESFIEYSQGPGIASFDGTQLTLIGAKVHGNEYGGLRAYGTNLYIFDSIFTSNTSQALYLVNCRGTIDNNMVTLNSNGIGIDYGVGIEIVNGSLTVKNNTLYGNADDGLFVRGSFFEDGDLPIVQATANKIQNNGYYGIESWNTASLIADRNYIAVNWGGTYLYSVARALFTNNIIVRSTNLAYGDGMEVDRGTSARLVNNTIYLNAHNGVLLTNGTVDLWNSIISGNRAGNLSSNVPANSVQNCLQTDPPGFLNADSNDFSLATGSPAIDGGSNDLADLPYLDYDGRLRIASSSELPGKGTVDIGAVEANSGYPLIYPLAINGSESTLGWNFTTGIAFANPTDSETRLDFTAYDNSGNKLSGAKINPAAEEKFGPHRQKASLEYQLFEFDDIYASAIGSVLGSSQNKVTGFLSLNDSEYSHFST